MHDGFYVRLVTGDLDEALDRLEGLRSFRRSAVDELMEGVSDLNHPIEVAGIALEIIALVRRNVEAFELKCLESLDTEGVTNGLELIEEGDYVGRAWDGEEYWFLSDYVQDWAPEVYRPFVSIASDKALDLDRGWRSDSPYFALYCGISRAAKAGAVNAHRRVLRNRGLN